MGLPVFEIVEFGFEQRITTFLSGRGYEFLPKRKQIHSDGAHPGIEQDWSINSAGQEIAVLAIIETNKGKKILIWGPLRSKRHKAIYLLLQDEVPTLPSH
jgi:hypothetical protein